MTISALVPLANGFEELEAISVIDILRRADIQVSTASIETTTTCTGSHGVSLTADSMIDEHHKNPLPDIIILPGGMPGSQNLSDCTTLIDLLTKQKDQQRWIAAICAAPAVVLARHNLTVGARITCYPSFQKQLSLTHPSSLLSDEPVVTDIEHKLITSQGPGTAFCFALRLVAILSGEECANRLASDTLAHWWKC